MLQSSYLKVMAGWITIRVVMSSEKVMIPKIYIDYGEGFSESRVIYMGQIDDETYFADIMLSSIPKSIRFDPTEEPVDFSISLCQIKVHNVVVHTIHQFASIMRHDFRSEEDTLRILKKSYARYKKHQFQGMIDRLGKEYKKLHPYRFQRSTPGHIAYMNWIRDNEIEYIEPLDNDLLEQMPVISVVMTVYNVPKEYLKKAIDSVINQTYPYWELCIVDDASQNRHTIPMLKKYESDYDRIHIKFRENNGNISIATNDALALATGEFVAFMDHDDMLVPNALYEVVKAVNRNPNAKFIYSDEDKIDEKERRYDPHFKSDWNPDMFLSQNYLSHLSVIDRRLVEEVGAFREGYEGAQDYDLFLRIIDRISAEEIMHIDKILYHWRAIEGSTAFDASEKSYTTEAGLRALRDYFHNREISATVKIGILPNTYKVVYNVPEEPLVSLIIPTRDGYDILSLCIKSILEKTIYKNYEIIIVDNQTTDPKTLAYFGGIVATNKNIRIVKYDEEFNYAAINNFGVEHAQGELIGLVNNDVEVISNYWLTEMVQHVIRPEIGAVGAKLYYENDTIQHAGVILGIGGVAGHAHKHYLRNAHGYFSRLKIIQNLSAVTSACLLIRKTIYREVEGMNEEHLKVAFNDVDFCLKVHTLGYRNLWTPYVELYHHESVSRGIEDNDIKKARFDNEVQYMKRTWGKMLQVDRYYSRNLTLQHENFDIRKTAASNKLPIKNPTKTFGFFTPKSSK